MFNLYLKKKTTLQINEIILEEEARGGVKFAKKYFFLNTTNASLQTAYPYNYLPTNKPKYQSMPNLSYGVGMHYSTLYKLTHIWNTKNGWG